LVHRVEALISRKALQHNFSVARQHAGNSKLVAMIKANAYGHGLQQVAEALKEADVFGVTDVVEAELLHQAGCTTPLLILQGLISPSQDAALIIRRGYQCVIHRAEDIALLDALCTANPPPHPLTLWLKLDSGMGRLGLLPASLPLLYQSLKSKPWLGQVILMTHLASSSEPDAALNAYQLARFTAVQDTLEPVPSSTSIEASAGLLASLAHTGFARPGIMLYGSSPFAFEDTSRRREAFGLQAVMTLRARLLSIKEYQAGDNIGYNSQFVCPHPMRIGIVSCGYADGYPSNTPNGCPVLVEDIRCSTVGRVSMDMMAIDLTACPQARADMLVTLWGATLSVDEIAHHTGILSYNLTCSVANRVSRQYV